MILCVMMEEARQGGYFGIISSRSKVSSSACPTRYSNLRSATRRASRGRGLGRRTRTVCFPPTMNVRDDWFHGIHAHSLPTAFTPGKEPHAEENDGAPLPKLPNAESRVLTLAAPAELAKLDLYGTLHEKHTRLTVGQLRAMYADVRERTARALSGLSPEAMRATPEPSLNPLDWGLGHVAHFYEFMVLKLLSPDDPPVLPGHDVHALFDSFRAAHDDRWKPRDVVGKTTERAEVGSREMGGGRLARVVGLLNRSNQSFLGAPPSVRARSD